MMRRPEGMAENISDLSGLSQTRPGWAMMFTFFFFSLAGIPIFLGFFAKLFVFMAAVEAGLYGLVIVAVISSVIATFYYLSVIRTIWMAEPAAEFVRNQNSAARVTAIGSAAVVLLGLIALLGPLTSYAAVAAKSLFPEVG